MSDVTACKDGAQILNCIAHAPKWHRSEIRSSSCHLIFYGMDDANIVRNARKSGGT